MPRPLYLLAAPVAGARGRDQVRDAAVRAERHRAGRAGRRAHGSAARRVVTSAALGAATVALLRRGGVPGRPGLPDRRSKFTTLDRFEGTPSTSVAALGRRRSGSALPFLLAVTGAVACVLRPFTDRSELIGARRQPGQAGAARAVLTAGSALLAPIEQIRIHTETSLYKHVGFGLVLAAPIAGVGLARIIGDHFRRTQVGIAIWGAVAGDRHDLRQQPLRRAGRTRRVFIADLARYVQPRRRATWSKWTRCRSTTCAATRGRPAAPVHLDLLHRLHRTGRASA